MSDCAAISTEGETAARGGAIFASNGVALIHSVVSHGRAIAQGTAFRAYGGCVRQDNGPFTMKYSEVSDCSAQGSDSVSGGISSFATAVTISHSTIARNSATTAVGGAYFTGAVEIQSTIIAGNSSGTTAFDATFRDTTSGTGANNLFGFVSALPAGVGHVSATDPKLGPLTNRGGFTRIRLPLANSPAINAGNNSFSAINDQRGNGFPRVIGSAADIGAAEFDSDRIFNNGFD